MIKQIARGLGARARDLQHLCTAQPAGQHLLLRSASSHSENTNTFLREVWQGHQRLCRCLAGLHASCPVSKLAQICCNHQIIGVTHAQRCSDCKEAPDQHCCECCGPTTYKCHAAHGSLCLATLHMPDAASKHSKNVPLPNPGEQRQHTAALSALCRLWQNSSTLTNCKGCC